MPSVTKVPGVSSILLFSGSGINFPRPLYNVIPFQHDFFVVCAQMCNVYPTTSVVDPDPDPFAFGPPGSGSGSDSQRYVYGSGSGSFCGFCHQAKIVRKAFITTLLTFFLRKEDVNSRMHNTANNKISQHWHWFTLLSLATITQPTRPNHSNQTRGAQETNRIK